MRVNRLDLNQLACLDALLTEGSVSRAAKRVYLSQPAVSATLARLRTYFGDPLLVPAAKRRVTLTPFAVSLIGPVRDLLLQAQALTSRRPEMNPARIERQLTIVASDYVLSTVLAPMVNRACKEAPGLRFDLRSISGYLTEELDHGDVDLVVSRAAAVSPLHPSEPLFSDTFSCIAWSGNSDIGRSISLERYLSLGHVVTMLSRGKVPTVDQLILDAQGLRRRVEVKVPSFTLMPMCVVGTSRIATVQTRLARMLAKQWPLRVFRCPLEVPEIVTSVQWHRYQSHDAAILWARSTLRDVARAARLPVPPSVPK